MAKKLLFFTALLLVLSFVLASCVNDSNGNTAESNTNNSGTGTEAHTHSFEKWETVTAPTCTVDGVKERYCSCGEKQTASVMATGHIFGEWKTVKEPTEAEKGLQERACACGEKETKDLDMLPAVVGLTKEEWVNAHKLTNANSFTADIHETYDITIKVNGDNAHALISYNNESRTTAYSSIAEILEEKSLCTTSLWASFSDFGKDFERIVTKYLDFAYDKFTYNDAEGCYTITENESYDNYTDIKTIKVYFNESKLISKISIFLRSGHEDDTSVSSAEMLFTNYNSTNLPTIPVDLISSLFNLPLDTNRIYLRDSEELYGQARDDALDAFNSLLTADLSKVIGYQINEYGTASFIKSVWIDTGRASISIGDNEYSFTCMQITERKDGNNTDYTITLAEENLGDTVRIAYFTIKK